MTRYADTVLSVRDLLFGMNLFRNPDLINGIDLNVVKRIALTAGDAIMEIYSRDFQVEFKDDRSPLTEADRESNRIICNGLSDAFPAIPIMSEENREIGYEERKDWDCYWCIDPIDGTKEFIKKNGQFTVNIALIADSVPVLGVVYAPVLKTIYSAKQSDGAYRELVSGHRDFVSREKMPLRINEMTSDAITVVASKSHMSEETERFIDDLDLHTDDLILVSKGSSLKLCMVAEGEGDIYPRIAPTMEWDTAAAHAVVLESGKGVYKYDDKIMPMDYLAGSFAKLESLDYNKPDLLNPFFVVA